MANEQNPNQREEEIRSRAYQLWEQAGKPRGNIDAFWYQAEKDLLAERDAATDGNRASAGWSSSRFQGEPLGLAPTMSARRTGTGR